MLMSGMFDEELFRACSNAHAVSGHEGEMRNIFRKTLEGIGTIRTSPSGNIYCEKQSTPEAPRVMLEAHMDEVGFLVQSITADGYLALVPVGGWWNHTLPSQRVSVRVRDGRKIAGMIAAAPPHFLSESQKKGVLPTEALFADVGASSAEEAEAWGIYPGAPVTPDVPAQRLTNPHRWMGKAFDNRAGFYTMLRAAGRLGSEALPCSLSAVGTVQEEVGTRGAKTLDPSALPDCVIVLEGPPADDFPGAQAGVRQGVLGGGVQIRAFDPTAIMNPALVELACRTAQECGIPYQLTVRRSGGTDAGSIHLLGQGIPCVVLGVPARYIHAHNGIIDESDVEAVENLAVELVRRLDAATVASLTDYEARDRALNLLLS